jgi:hypothetical protein
LALLGCSKDPAREEAQRVQRDQVLLNGIVDEDLKAERALVEVGDVERQHRLEDAARVVDNDAIPAADRAIDAAKRSQPESAWGRARKDELLLAMTDRRDELPRYAAALRAQDLEQQLASVEKQLAIEKRAMTVAQAIKDGPEAPK